MRTKNKKITVTVDASTWRWLRALARANQKSDMLLAPSTPEGILAQAAFCFADAAGRRTGSWEASVGQSLLDSSGFQKSVGYPDYDLCQRHDYIEAAAWRAEYEAKQKEGTVPQNQT